MMIHVVVCLVYRNYRERWVCSNFHVNAGTCFANSGLIQFMHDR